MICHLPDELLPHVLLYTQPRQAHLLSKACVSLRASVREFYDRNAATLVKPGGAWHHCVASKRTRTSLSNKNQIVSTAPLGVESILNQKCAECGVLFRASVHKDFGIIAHAECIRPFLLNIYYLEKFGLTDRHFDNVPTCELNGYNTSHGTYEYTTVWKDKTHGIVPYEWTAHYLVHHVYHDHIREHHAEQERRRLAREQAAKKARQDQQKRVRTLRNERIERLIAAIDTLDHKQVKKVIATKLPQEFNPKFFGLRNLEHHEVSDKKHDEAKHLILNLHRLLRDMSADQIADLHYNDLDKDFRELCRSESKHVLDNTVSKVVERMRPRPIYTSQKKPRRVPQARGKAYNQCNAADCTNVVSHRCLLRLCGKCCDSPTCEYHLQKKLENPQYIPLKT